MPPVSAPRRRRKEDRPHELLDAALALFVEKGFAATRTDDVALRAGVSKGTLYLYFPSKEDLLRAVIEHSLSTRIAEGAAIFAGYTGSTAELLRHMLAEWWTQMYDSPASGVFKLIITEVRNFPEIAEYYEREVVERAHELLGGILRQGMARGEFRQVDVDAAVHSLILPLIMMCLHRHSVGACEKVHHGLDGPRFISQHIELLLDGLRAPVPPAAAPAPTHRKVSAR